VPDFAFFQTAHATADGRRTGGGPAHDPHKNVPAAHVVRRSAPERRLLPDATDRRRRRQMTGTRLWGGAAALIVTIVVTAGLARADVSGSRDGQLTVKKTGQSIAAAGVLSQSGTSVTGTIAIAGDPAAGGGAYLVNGRATPKVVKVTGVASTGASVTWRAKIVGDTLQGKARLKGAGVKVAGTLTLALNPPVADGTACDGVFTANQAFFSDQVLGTALVACTACHVPGGQAADTRFHVTANDALATARAVAPFVDSANPDGSRILEKPLAVLPHGGGQQITPGSPQDMTLRQWVGMIAAAGCS
jgi:hypothetical protein